MQTRELQDYCTRRGWTVAGEYVDVGISGTKEKRPELDRLLSDAHRRRFDAVVVWKFDRFASVLSRKYVHIVAGFFPGSNRVSPSRRRVEPRHYSDERNVRFWRPVL